MHPVKLCVLLHIWQVPRSQCDTLQALVTMIHELHKSMYKAQESESETFAVNYRWTRLIILAFRNPHLLEGAERRQNGASNPN